MDAQPPPTAHVVPPPAPIPEMAAVCHQYVLGALGMSLDFTPETLPLLDHYILRARDDAADRPDLLQLLTQAVGAYFGEVLRHKWDGFWLIRGADAQEWRLCLHGVFLSLSPMGVAEEVLGYSTSNAGRASGLALAPEDRELVEARLAALPPVPEDEYYLLSTRFDVIETAVEALRGAMIEGGQADVRFDEEDYEEGAATLR